MKILHTADWHLGKKLEGFYRLNEQKDVLNEICQIADNEDVDVILIAGDIFDTYNPPTEATELFYRTVHRIAKNASRLVLVIAGNHDSPDRIEAPEPLAIQNGIFFIGYPDSQLDKIKLDSGIEVLNSEPGFAEFTLPGIKEPLRILLTPYSNEFRLKKAFNIEDRESEFTQLLNDKWQYLAGKYCDQNGVNILLSHHFFVAKNWKTIELTDEEKPIVYVGGTQSIDISCIPHQIHYTALGHLHRNQNIGSREKNIFYSGSPLSYSFAEAEQQKYVIISEFQDGKIVKIENIKLEYGKMLVRKKFENIDEAVQWLKENQNCLVELTIRTDNYLSSEDRRNLNSLHEGIISIHPELTNHEILKNRIQDIDTEQNMESLFRDYFLFRKNLEPNNRLTELFREIIGE